MTFFPKKEKFVIQRFSHLEARGAFIRLRNLYKICSLVIWPLYTCLIPSNTWASESCLLIQESQHIWQEEGNCERRHSPCSTFKIPLSLMGFDSGILINLCTPEWNFKPGYVDWIEAWKKPHTPATWIKNSCVWYSQVMTKKLGQHKFKTYVTKFKYGNQDISGDKDKNNGLTYCWLSSSLKISAREQVLFLQKLTTGGLPVTHTSHQLTKELLFVQELPQGWRLYGKRGGYLLNQDGSPSKNRQIGWFVGWVEKDSRTIVFAHYIEDKHKMSSPAGKRAQTTATKKMLDLIGGIAP